MNQATTIATRLTPRGRGAVASIIVQGELGVLDRYFRAANSKPANEQIADRICYGLWGDTHQEDVVGIKTSDDRFEIHCHGGSVAVDRILKDLESLDVSIEAKSTMNASLANEFAACLQQATTQRTAHFILRQSQVFPPALRAIQKSSPEEASQRAKELLEWSHFGTHLTKPSQVVLCGSPNVGKSSLINALVGFSRSVVFDQPGTTRDVVTVQTAFEGWPIELSDTAGIRDSNEGLESLGIEKAKARIQLADLLLVVVDAREGMNEFDELLLQSHRNSILVLNKIDLLDELSEARKHIMVSAIDGTGISELSTAIVARLIPNLPSDEQPFPITNRQVQMLQECIC